MSVHNPLLHQTLASTAAFLRVSPHPSLTSLLSIPIMFFLKSQPHSRGLLLRKNLRLLTNANLYITLDRNHVEITKLQTHSILHNAHHRMLHEQLYKHLFFIASQEKLKRILSFHPAQLETSVLLSSPFGANNVLSYPICPSFLPKGLPLHFFLLPHASTFPVASLPRALLRNGRNHETPLRQPGQLMQSPSLGTFVSELTLQLHTSAVEMDGPHGKQNILNPPVRMLPETS